MCLRSLHLPLSSSLVFFRCSWIIFILFINSGLVNLLAVVENQNALHIIHFFTKLACAMCALGRTYFGSVNLHWILVGQIYIFCNWSNSKRWPGNCLLISIHIGREKFPRQRKLHAHMAKTRKTYQFLFRLFSIWTDPTREKQKVSETG